MPFQTVSPAHYSGAGHRFILTRYIDRDAVRSRSETWLGRTSDTLYFHNFDSLGDIRSSCFESPAFQPSISFRSRVFPSPPHRWSRLFLSGRHFHASFSIGSSDLPSTRSDMYLPMTGSILNATPESPVATINRGCFGCTSSSQFRSCVSVHQHIFSETNGLSLNFGIVLARNCLISIRD